MIKEAVEILSQKKNLSAEQMRQIMEEIMTGQAEKGDIISFLLAMNKKGETVEELTAAVSVMRAHAVKIKPLANLILDTCGTGGDKKGTFNVSTAVAFVACAAGITVAKHGNRSVSSSCGSADILEALGVDINMNKEKIQQCLDAIGIAFLFAPNMHPAMKYAMPARKEIKEKTMFNILGPLTNPAGATHQLIGVYDNRFREILAEVLVSLGTVHAMVVHSKEGLDEISTAEVTYVSEAKDSRVHSYAINPQSLCFRKNTLEQLKGTTALENARILIEIFKGEKSPYRDIVILNAAAAIYVADKAGSLEEGIKLAAESIDSGKALTKLEELKEYSRK
ncbi:MAG: anthranilate phosphoribosyltransferase [Candidatus Omnitrophota bacterium]|nr:MAG: anthranilate phosphoribosyltransferase [Candidatus Omnitrophota bacterium]